METDTLYPLEPLSHDLIKSVVLFDVSDDCLEPLPPGRQPVLFQDPAGLEILNKMAVSLRKSGFSTSEPKRGKGCDAVFLCNFEGFYIVAIVSIGGRFSGAADCLLKTWPGEKRPLIHRILRRKQPPDREVNEKWSNLCLVIVQILREVVQAQSIVWTTENEASAYLARMEIAGIMERFVEGKSYKQEWNDFVESSQRDKKLDAYRERCTAIDSLVNRPGEADPDAIAELRTIVKELRSKEFKPE